MSAVPEDAYRAAWQVIMSGGTLEAALEAAEPHFRAAERERIYAELGNDHYVIFTEDRWTVEHSVECRLSGQMPECAYHAAVATIADEPRPEMLGRWRIDEIDSEGLPSLVRADGEDAPGRPCDGPEAAGQGAAGVAPRAQP